MKMRASILFLSLFWVYICGLSAQNSDRYGIIPQPKELISGIGEFVINRHTVVLVDINNDEYKELADNFVRQVQKVSGINIPVKDVLASPFPENAILFKEKENLPNEGYELSVTPKRITIESAEPNGLFYGIQTLYQLLPAQIYGGKKVAGKIKWEIPCCHIKDAPRFAYRGLMLDVGRHFMPKEFVMKLIDLMAMHKQNMFHWHLTEDQGWRIEIKKYPKLTEIGAWRKETSGYEGTPGDGKPHGGFYTQEDVKEIVEYARQRYVTIIPEIEIPGHASAAIAAYPELSCFPDRKYEVPTGWGVKKDVFCPNDKTFRFLEDVFTELFDLFPSPYYHIGGDESPRSNWKECAHCQDLMKTLGLQNEDELQMLFVERMERFLREKGGRKVIGWDEIIDGNALPNTIVMAYRGHARAIRAANQCQYTILTPNRWCYLDYYQEDPDTEELSMFLFLPLKKVYDYDPVPASLSADKQKYILGHQGSVWTEYIPYPERAEYMIFPRAIAMAEVGWNAKDNKNWDFFRQKMVKEFDRLDHKEVNYSKAFYRVIYHYDRKSSFPKKVGLSIDYPGTTVRYTVNGEQPTLNAPIYSDSITVNKGDVVRAQGFLSNGNKVGMTIEKKFSTIN